jgi:hypothetical protein
MGNDPIGKSAPLGKTVHCQGQDLSKIGFPP